MLQPFPALALSSMTRGRVLKSSAHEAAKVHNVRVGGSVIA